MASRSASSGIAQKMVSRMIIGGSAGFRMMIALPRLAPPMVSTPLLVVLVNSSMLARVPGPAEAEATDATISAYGAPGRRPRAHGVHDRDGGLPAAGDHVDVRSVEVRAQVGRRDDGRADGRRGEVDGADAGLGVSRGRIPVHVGAGGLEHQVGLLVEAREPIDAFVTGLQTRACARGPDPRTRGRCRPSSAAPTTPSAAACTAGRC